MLTKDKLLAGKAIFTVSNGKGKHYTFKIEKSKDGRCYFVKLLNGRNNLSDYLYLGLLASYGDVLMTRGSKLKEDSPPVKVVRWAIKKTFAQESLPDGYSIHHANRCLRCCRPLTHPDGLDPKGSRYGFGAECFDKINKGL